MKAVSIERQPFVFSDRCRWNGEKGTMMKIKIRLRYFVRIAACLLGCGMMCGCGVRDAALVLPLEEGAAEEREGGVKSDLEESAEVPLSQQKTEVQLVVYVCGAVANPGVVELPEGSRVDAALQAAGGFTENAKRDYVNLAARLEDGQMLYFPTTEEAEKMEADNRAAQLGLVNINTADAELLMTLPGIGEARALDIIAYREEHGAFEKKEDLKKVSGIKENMYKKLEAKIVIQ